MGQSARKWPKTEEFPPTADGLSLGGFLGPGRRQHAAQTVVALVARVLEQLAAGALPVNGRGPRLGPHRRVVHREGVFDGVVGGPPEAFDEPKVLVGEHVVST